MSERFACYLALGDSMSIDFYPAQDQRFPNLAGKGAGAASLFFKNIDEEWAEFIGHDLNRMYPNIYFSEHAFDGATTADLLTPTRLAELEPFRTARVIATLTIGGNDLLEALRSFSDPSKFERHLTAIQARYRQLLQELQNRLTNAVFLIGTIYDPTDSTGALTGHPIYKDLPIHLLQKFNDFIRSAVAEMSDCIICDIHAHFMGHGITSGSEMWYWTPSPIEPGAQGASEIRRVWLQSLKTWLDSQ